MGSLIISRALLLALALACARVAALSPLSAAGDDNDCALYLSGPGRTSAYDYSLNLLKGNFGYEGQHTCITYDAINQAYLEARNRIVVSQPKGEWKAEDFASAGELILDISINLARRYGLTYEEIEKGLPLIDTSRTLIRDVCPPVFSHVECRAGKFRRLDGLCNNLQHPTWGSTMSPFQRLLGPLFADGINAPRIAHTGRDLPLSRVVSRTMHPDDGFHDHAGTVMVIAWGQFMDHDYTLTGTPLDPINRNDPEECCKRPQHLKHPYCNEIRIPDDDYFYRLWNVKCIDFVRAFPSPRPGCRLGSRVPFNTLTGVIDGNTVYGVTDKFSRKLRTGFGGLLRMNPVFKEYGLKDLLPLKLDIPDEGCTRPNKNMYCFEGGEIRVNEQLVLTVMHTLMAREHNRIAQALARVNPHWDDETVFQEARRINIAEIQHITYNEFLPILLGKDVMEKFGLVLEKEGYWNGYDQSVNPDVIDAFASAAFRFGHSLLPTAVERWSKAHKFIASKRLSDLIRRPFDLYRAGVLDEYVMGLMNQVAQAMDDSITQEVTNHLFKKVGARFGMDLVSFNMQRGREFGIPGYMEFRKFCGLNGAETFQDLFGSMPNETVRKYESIFEHPIDVDLWSGGVSERPLPGSMLGPTFACVIATQFSYSRRGDRFWFELPNQPSSFTPEQLVEIRKARLARIICDNTDIIDTVQLYPMVLPDHELNPRVPCRSGIIPSMDFSKWADPAPFHSAKSFITDAYIFAKNATEKGDQLNTHDSNGKKETDTAVKNSLNRTELGDINPKYTANSTQVPCNGNYTIIKICPENNPNCSECQNNLNVSYKTDTVLKYVYKNKEDKKDKSIKSSGHLKNSVKRKRRSTSNARITPIVVNYETSHEPPVAPTLDKPTSNIIDGSALADFNIETLHDNPPNKNSQGKNNKGTNHIKSEEKTNESQDSKENIERAKAVQDSNESAEKGEYTKSGSHQIGEESSENNKENNKRYRKESDSREDDSTEQGNLKDRGSPSDDSRENHEHDQSLYKEPKYSEEKSYYKEQPHESQESYRKNEKTSSHYPESNEYRNEDRKNIPYREHELSEEKSYYKTDKYDRRLNSFHPESRERNKYLDNSSKYSGENNDSYEENNSRSKSKHSAPLPDSNEGGERIEEFSNIKEDSREHFHNKDENKSDYSKRDESLENNNKEYSDDKVIPENEHPKYSAKKQQYITDKLASYRPLQHESQEEETIIAIMKKKKKKPLTPSNDYNIKRKEDISLSSPIKIKDVDLGDFNNYERIQVNDKGVVKAVTENYDTLSSPLIKPLTIDLKSDIVEDNGKQFARSTSGTEIPSSNESDEETNRPVQIDDGEVKPVIEIKEESLENSKEAIKANSDEDVSLETFLGVKKSTIVEKSQKNVDPPSEQIKGDVKLQFERIPLNYNHVKKEEENNQQPNEKYNDGNSETQNENSEIDENSADVFTNNEPVKYDEHLNFKFDDVSIKLPEIKLPQDILSYPHEKTAYVPKEKTKKEPRNEKFFHYDEEEYHDEKPHGPDHENIHNADEDDESSYYGGYYGKVDKKENSKIKEKQEENDDDDDDEEEEDLYEKFVRERFGKSSTFAKRSEKLTSPTKPAEENAKLFQALNLVLKKAANIENEAQKSGDPNAGYMWTVEYGQPL